MKNVLKPHTSRWFDSLRKYNPVQASHTRMVLKLARTKDACSMCGASPCGDYAIGKTPRLTMRLCEICRKMHELFGLAIRPLELARTA